MSEVRASNEAKKALNVFIASDLGPQFQTVNVLPMLKFILNF